MHPSGKGSGVAGKGNAVSIYYGKVPLKKLDLQLSGRNPDGSFSDNIEIRRLNKSEFQFRFEYIVSNPPHQNQMINSFKSGFPIRVFVDKSSSFRSLFTKQDVVIYVANATIYKQEDLSSEELLLSGNKKFYLTATVSQTAFPDIQIE